MRCMVGDVDESNAMLCSLLQRDPRTE